MSSAPPIVSPSDSAALRPNLVAALRANVPGWQEFDPNSGAPDQGSAALIEIFTRFCNLVIERLNRVPEKNLLAFLDLLGSAPLPPQPARVPLTFTMVAGSTVDAVVPRGTQVGALALAGETGAEQVIFETERELTAVPVTVQTLIAVDGTRDSITDISALLASTSEPGTRMFSGEAANEHFLYIGHNSLGLQNLLTATIQIGAVDDPANEIHGGDLVWEFWDGTAWQKSPTAPSMSEPSGSFNSAYTFQSPVPIPTSTIAGVSNCWMRVRAPLPISPSPTPVVGMACAGRLPSLASVDVRVTVRANGLAPDAVFVNDQALDVTKPFLPFGEKPKLGDTLYISSRTAFGQPLSSVSVRCPVINPAGGAATASPPPTKASSDLVLRWEAWDGSEWMLLGLSTPGEPPAMLVTDPTHAFTNGESAIISISLPQTPLALTTINGITSYWIRVQIAAGNYGIEAFYKRNPDPPGGFTLEPATFAPPVLGSVLLDYNLSTNAAPARVIAGNARELEDVSATLAKHTRVPAFRALPAQPPTLYMALATPPERPTFPTKTINLYHALKPVEYGALLRPLDPDLSIADGAPGAHVPHSFTLTNERVTVETYTLFTRSGSWARSVSPSEVTLDPGQSARITVTVDVPAAADLTARDSGLLLARARSDDSLSSVRFETRGQKAAAPRRSVRWEYWNGSAWVPLLVADATANLTRSDILEFFGPGDIVPANHFGIRGYWLRALFEPGNDAVEPRLRMLLPNTTFASHTVTMLNELLGSSDASENQQFQTTRAPVLAGQSLEVREGDTWTQWTEVPDLYGSDQQDRHYVLDHITGQVRFGDGVRGRIPPRATSNIRMARYQTGGGSRGKRPPRTIVQLKDAVSFIEAVFNPDAAGGGFEAESNAELIERAPRMLRNGGRAVAAEDYEDLARLASAEVARAKCVPLRSLRTAPLGTTPLPGFASLIIVPATTDAKPRPSAELLARVEKFLLDREATTADIAVVGPLYVRVDVDVDVAIVTFEGANQVEQAVRGALAAFLHPLTGGRDGTGWDFGREPHVSDLHAVVSAVPGVDHIRHLRLTQLEELTGVTATGRFLVHSGEHLVKVTFAGAP